MGQKLKHKVATIAFLVMLGLFLCQDNSLQEIDRNDKSYSPNLHENCQCTINNLSQSHSKWTKVAFAKTHKTGSSTLQNILLRFGVNHDLNFVFPKNSWMFSVLKPWNTEDLTNGPWKQLEFDIFAAHSVWDRDKVRTLIPDAKFVTLLRHPVDVYESLFVFMGLQKFSNMTINEYVVKLEKGEHRVGTAYVNRNPLLWDFGMNVSDMDDVVKVESKIASLEKQFDLVMITEKFAESMILMKDLLQWDIDDVRYLTQNARVNSQRSTMSNKTLKFLKDWMWADMMLYEHFSYKFENLLAEYGEGRILMEVDKLERRNKALKNSCTAGEVGFAFAKDRIPMVNKLVGANDKPWCGPFVWQEIEFVKMIREYQNGKVVRKRLKGEIAIL